MTIAKNTPGSPGLYLLKGGENVPKVRRQIDFDMQVLDYANDKEVQQHLGVESRNDFVEKALKQYDPSKDEESPHFLKWKNQK